MKIKHIFKLLLLSILFCLSSAMAATVTSRQSGNWNAAATWMKARTGTISVNNNATAVTGAGTSFTTELAVGNVIMDDSGTVLGTISVITNNTNLTLAAGSTKRMSNDSYTVQAVPAATDDVVVQTSSDNTVTVTANAICASITTGSANKDAIININAGVLLTVNGDVILNDAPSNTVTHQIILAAGAMLTVNGNVALSPVGNSGNRIATITLGNSAATVVIIAGDITGNALSGIIFSGQGFLNVGGSWVADSPSLTAGTGTVVYNGTGAQIMKPAAYYHWTVSKTAGTTSLDIGTTSVAGDLSDDGKFNSSGQLVTFNGTVTQNLIGGATNTTIGSVTLSNANGLNLSHNLTVNTTLTFTSGRIVTGANRVIIPAGGTVTGAAASTFVAGNLQKNVVVGANVSQTFEIGSNSAVAYAPVTLLFASVSIAGDVTAGTTNSDHPQIASSSIDSAKSANRYWTLTNSGVTFTTYHATFTFIAADVDVGANTANFVVNKWNGVSWSAPTTGTRTATSTQGTGLTSFSDFIVGEGGAVATPGGFNAYETTTAANAITGVIKTKISGSSFNLDIIALNSAKDAILTSFTGDVKVEILNANDNSAALDANGCRSSWSVIQTLATQTFVAGNNGRKTVAFQENNAYPNARIRISYPTSSPTAIGCSTDNFAIRPNSFSSLSVTDADWETAGMGRNLNNTAANGGVVHKAGRPFTMSATAVNALSNTTTNYSGSPSAVLSALLQPTGCGGCVLGAFNVGTWSAVAGVVTTTTASYSEVGAFDMSLSDTNFADVDLADSSSAERSITSATFSVGRFVPDHFVVAPNNTPQFRTFNVADGACSTPPSGPARSFTYIGQNFGYVTAPQILITAQNFSNATTINYSSNLWKLASANVSQVYSSTQSRDADNIGAATIVANNDGTGTATANSADTLRYTRSTAAPVAPFNADISLAISVSDNNEVGPVGNGAITSSAAATFNGGGSGIAFDSGNVFRYGLLKISNAIGSVRLDLPVPMETQYWNGAAFITNTGDNCTTVVGGAGGNVNLSNWRVNLAAGEMDKSHINNPVTFTLGRSNLRLSKPSGGDGTYNGSVDLSIDLSAEAKTYLQGNWTGGTYTVNPSARAAFGLFKGASEFIYQRENY